MENRKSEERTASARCRSGKKAVAEKATSKTRNEKAAPYQTKVRHAYRAKNLRWRAASEGRPYKSKLKDTTRNGGVWGTQQSPKQRQQPHP
jgi:hypothetical protein